MAEGNQEVSIMFADIAGSTQLYERLGDQVARAAIADCIVLMSTQVQDSRGRIIKTIGDEIMCAFPQATDAVAAARAIQLAVSAQLFSGVSLKVRIGVHHGPVIEEGEDIFGDAVNVAARMAGIARGGQIIVTGECVSGLTSAQRSQARLVDQAPVKGKAEPVDVYEVVWEDEGVTHIMQAIDLDAAVAPDSGSITLCFGASEVSLSPGQSPLVIGRAPGCDLVISSAMASRQHARIEYRRGKFILVDQSTNGTCVRLGDGQSVFLKREELPLWGVGKISPGESPQDDAAISFDVAD